jgi:hypothetical protein
MGNHLEKVVRTVVGSVLLLAGLALLVLPGPGLLLVLAGLVVLAGAFPSLERHLEPVRRRAVAAARESVSSPWRIAASATVGAALIAGGVVWTALPDLPLGGWPTGSGLILSGVVLCLLLEHSRRRVRAAGPERERAGT